MEEGKEKRIRGGMKDEEIKVRYTGWKERKRQERRKRRIRKDKIRKERNPKQEIRKKGREGET